MIAEDYDNVSETTGDDDGENLVKLSKNGINGIGIEEWYFQISVSLSKIDNILLHITSKKY